jgi:hypothetical protein
LLVSLPQEHAFGVDDACCASLLFFSPVSDTGHLSRVPLVYSWQAPKGWPKNILHWHGIHESILDVCATIPVDFVIADGIDAMEGNGPLQGELRHLGRIVLANDPVAADATCARLMGIDPRLIFHIAEAGRFLGNMDQNRITMLAEGMPRNIEPFRVIPQFQNLQIRA